MKLFNATSLLIIVLLAVTSCRREKYYRCECSSSDSTALYEIGRSSQDNAYAVCKTHEDSATTCVMWVMK